MNFNRQFLLVAAILCLGLLKVTKAQNVWTKEADCPGTGRHHAASFAIGHKGYIGTGGTIYNGPNVNDFWAWDQSTNTWTQVAALPASVRWAATGFAINGIGYVGFGVNGSTAYGDLWAYNESTNSWTAKTGLTSNPRLAAFCFVIGDSVAYVGGGDNGSFNNLNDVWKYSPATDSWTSEAALSNGMAYAAGFTLNGMGYGACGYNNTTGYLNWFIQYDPVTNVWTPKANVPGLARSGASGFALGGHGYVGFGTQVTDASLGDFYSYNDLTDTWTPIANAFPDSARQAAAVFTIGDAVYLGTGTTVFQPSQIPPTYNTRTLWQFGLATAGVKNVKAEETIATYPNPASDLVNIVLPVPSNVTICNMFGQQVYRAVQQMGKVSIDVSDFSDGTYLLNAVSDGNVTEGKFVVQR